MSKLEKEINASIDLICQEKRDKVNPKKKRLNKTPKKESEIITFRVGTRIFELLAAVAKGDFDALGNPISVNDVARKLMIASLEEAIQKPKAKF